MPPNPINPKLEQEFCNSLNHEFPEIPTYDQFIRTLPFFKNGFPDDQLDDFAATGNLLYTRYIWYRAGRPIYEIRPDIFRALMETDLPGDFLVDELKTPYEGMLVKFPKAALRELNQFYPETVFVTNVTGDFFRVIGDSREADQLIHTKLAICPEMTIDQAIIHTIKNCSYSMQEKSIEALRAFYQDSPTFKFAVNLVLYLICPEVDLIEDRNRIHKLHDKLQYLKKGHKRDLLKEQLKQTLNSGKTYIVGASFRPIADDLSNLTESGKKWVMSKRIRVPGFWRWQPHGPKSSLRRRQFIQPHWRGPTFAEIVERGFVVR